MAHSGAAHRWYRVIWYDEEDEEWYFVGPLWCDYQLAEKWAHKQLL